MKRWFEPVFLPFAEGRCRAVLPLSTLGELQCTASSDDTIPTRVRKRLRNSGRRRLLRMPAQSLLTQAAKNLESKPAKREMPRAGLDPDILAEAAAAIIDAEGVSAMTLARLAAEFGVAPPSLYKHVSGLDDLILRVITLALRRLTEVLATATMGRSGREALFAMADAYRSFAVNHAGLYSLTQTYIKPSDTAQITEALRTLEVFGAAIRSYNVPEDLTIHALRMVRACLHGFADIQSRGAFQMSPSVDESYRILILALDASLIRLGKNCDESEDSSKESSS